MHKTLVLKNISQFNHNLIMEGIFLFWQSQWAGDMRDQKSNEVKYKVVGLGGVAQPN